MFNVHSAAVSSIASDPASTRGAELAASFPLDAECCLRGDAGAKLVSHVVELIAAGEHRQKRLNARAAAQRYRTVEVLLANLVAAALHKFNPSRYVGVPFKRSAYTKLGLSCDAMVLARDAMRAAGLIEVVDGFRDDSYLGFISAGRVTRIRARAALRDLFDIHQVGHNAVQRRRLELIYLKRPANDAGPEPDEITASRTVLQRVNARIDRHIIDLPDESWERMRKSAAAHIRKRGADTLNIPFVGDPTAKALYRVFTREWTRGGRLYGGWWLNVPKQERLHLTIDGEPTVEIDFGNIHPALLYWARRKPLTKDPYHLPPYSRDLCKETFQRLINGSQKRGGADLKRPKEYKQPPGLAFSDFLRAYKHHLEEVAECFGRDLGLILQLGDSELAVSILGSLDMQGVIALPIHDSFMVQQRHQTKLLRTMEEIYHERFGLVPTLKITDPAPRGAPPPLLPEPVSA